MIKLDNLEISVEDQQKFFEKFLNDYTKPSFGSASKRDIDLSIFMLMQDLGIINTHPQIYEVVSLLHVTSSKARNLIYEASLRRSSEESLNAELLELLKEPIFMSTSDNMVAIEIDNPLLIDHLRQKLRDLKFITDGSHNRGIVKMSTTAYATLFYCCLPPKSLDELFPEMEDNFDKFVKIEDKDNKNETVKKILVWFLKTVLSKQLSAHIDTWMPKIKEIPSIQTIRDFISFIDKNNIAIY